MSSLYCVEAKLKDGNEYRTIWMFRAIPATSRKHAISEVKAIMKRIIGTISEYKWFAESEWENNMEVN